MSVVEVLAGICRDARPPLHDATTGSYQHASHVARVVAAVIRSTWSCTPVSWLSWRACGVVRCGRPLSRLLMWRRCLPGSPGVAALGCAAAATFHNLGRAARR